MSVLEGRDCRKKVASFNICGRDFLVVLFFRIKIMGLNLVTQWCTSLPPNSGLAPCNLLRPGLGRPECTA